MQDQNGSNLQEVLQRIIGKEPAQRLINVVLVVDKALSTESGPKVSRGVVAQALNMLLFSDLIERVPAANQYVDYCLAHGRTVMHDHGAVRTIAMEGMGLPAGETAITRILQPLGYSLKGLYPLERLKMTGRSYAQVEHPETIAQFFISELHPEKFTPEFQAALRHGVSTSVDPLTDEAKALLVELDSKHYLSVEQAVALLSVLVRCFGRQHGDVTLADYTTLLQESAEAAWILTEGNVFNHVTDRVEDVDALAEEQKALGQPMKDTVEKSQTGRVRQTAFHAAQVTRTFLAEDGSKVEKLVPGSFLEFITRLPLPEEVEGKKVLDLGFDSSNAQAIFKMTANTKA